MHVHMMNSEDRDPCQRLTITATPTLTITKKNASKFGVASENQQK